MKALNRRASQAQAETVDPRENPGSYIRQDDGTYVAHGPTFAPAGASNEAAPPPALPPESAAALAAALAEIGQDIPPAVEAVLAEAGLSPAPAPEAAPPVEPAPTSSAEA